MRLFPLCILLLLVSGSGSAQPVPSVKWKAQWIRDPRLHFFADQKAYQENPAPVFKKEIEVRKPLRTAVLHISALGYYEASANGIKIGNRVLEPSQTDYSHRIFYSRYDITGLLKRNKNSLEVVVGNGWYNPMPLRLFGRFNLQETLPVGEPALIAQIELVYTDGSRQEIATDQTWQVTDSEIRRNSIYLGEWIDLRVSNESRDWRKAIKAIPPAGKMEPHLSPSVVIGDTLAPVAMHPTKTGWLLDFGTNQTGVLQLATRLPAGTKLNVQYGELLYPDGSLNKMTSVTGQIKSAGVGGPGAPDTAYQQDVFISSGGPDVFRPKFTYHGFRYAEIQGYPGTPDTSAIRALVLHADVKETGSFSCSNPRINELMAICKRTFLSNLIGVQSDCPHREKLGYGGDIVATAESFIHLFDMSAFYAKTVIDFADAARPDGAFTETAPFVGIADEGYGGGSGPIEWGTAHPELLWQLYRYYGNKKLLREQYPNAKKWVEFLRSKAVDHQLHTTIGDHESVAPKDISVSATSFYYYNVSLLAQLAFILGKQEEAMNYVGLAEQIKERFVGTYISKDSGKVGIGTQATQAHALYFGLVPSHLKTAAFDYLVKDIKEKHSGHLSTGIFGTKYLLEVLGENGRADLAFDIITKEGFPGWMHMLDNGATSLWEHWAYSDNTFSHNHPMFGTVTEFFFRWIAGIRRVEKGGKEKGGKEEGGKEEGFIVQPDTRRLEWAKATVGTRNGKLSTAWKKTGNQLELLLEVPANTTVQLQLPTTETSRNLKTTILKQGKHTILHTLPPGW
jgi:alpha-L-rhamnosidase